MAEIYGDVFNKCKQDDILSGSYYIQAKYTPFVQLSLSSFQPHKRDSFSTLQLCTEVHKDDRLDRDFRVRCLTFGALYYDAFRKLGIQDADLKQAVQRLSLFWKNEKKHTDCLSRVLGKEKIPGRVLEMVFAHHIFEPLTVESDITRDTFSGGNSECPFCKSKQENIKNGNTSFGHKDLWHGRADIVIKQEMCRQVVTIADEDTDTEEDEPKSKMPRMEAGEFGPEFSHTENVDKTNLKWPILNIEECNQRPVPQIISQTIVNAFLVVKHNPKLEKHFIPCFVASRNGLMIALYNVHYDSLICNADYFPVCKMDRLLKWDILAIWILLNFDKFEPNTLETIKDPWLRKSGFREKISKHGVLNKYESELGENVEERRKVFQYSVDLSCAEVLENKIAASMQANAVK